MCRSSARVLREPYKPHSISFVALPPLDFTLHHKSTYRNFKNCCMFVATAGSAARLCSDHGPLVHKRGPDQKQHAKISPNPGTRLQLDCYLYRLRHSVSACLISIRRIGSNAGIQELMPSICEADPTASCSGRVRVCFA